MRRKLKSNLCLAPAKEGQKNFVNKNAGKQVSDKSLESFRS